MNNLRLTLAVVMSLAASQSVGSEDPLITHNTEPIPSITNQVDVKIKEAECLASVIYHESRGESKKGKIAVGHVIMNRVKNKLFPKTVCKVAFQPSQFTGLKRIKYDAASMQVAFKVMTGEYLNPIKRATHFHTTQVFPRWANKLSFVAQYGRHRFYQFA